jgi:pre-mRNA-processing factor 19
MHPDGILYAGGTKDGLVRVWDCRNASALAATVSVSAAAGKPLSTISFSQNGYYLAAASAAEPAVSVVDLRKLSVLASWTLPSDNVVSEVRFDHSAQFLSVAGTDLRVYANKTWDELLTFEDNAGVISGARFGPLGSEIVLGGMDRSLRVLGVKSEQAEE